MSSSATPRSSSLPAQLSLVEFCKSCVLGKPLITGKPLSSFNHHPDTPQIQARVLTQSWVFSSPKHCICVLLLQQWLGQSRERCLEERRHFSIGDVTARPAEGLMGESISTSREILTDLSPSSVSLLCCHSSRQHHERAGLHTCSQAVTVTYCFCCPLAV